MGSMRNDMLGLLFFGVTLFAVVASAYYAVLGWLLRDRLLSRAAVVSLLIFGVLAVVSFPRELV